MREPPVVKQAKPGDERGYVHEPTRLKLLGEHDPGYFKIPFNLVREDMRFVAPQAILRDLHRPVGKFRITGWDHIDVPWDRGARGATAGVHAIVTHRYRVDVTKLLPSSLHTFPAVRSEILGATEYPWENVPKRGEQARTTEKMSFMTPLEDVTV